LAAKKKSLDVPRVIREKGAEQGPGILSFSRRK
jgi:hypothetical protein